MRGSNEAPSHSWVGSCGRAVRRRRRSAAHMSSPRSKIMSAPRVEAPAPNLRLRALCPTVCFGGARFLGAAPLGWSQKIMLCTKTLELGSGDQDVAVFQLDVPPNQKVKTLPLSSPWSHVCVCVCVATHVCVGAFVCHHPCVCVLPPMCVCVCCRLGPLLPLSTLFVCTTL